MRSKRYDNSRLLTTFLCYSVNIEVKTSQKLGQAVSPSPNTLLCLDTDMGMSRVLSRMPHGLGSCRNYKLSGSDSWHMDSADLNNRHHFHAGVCDYLPVTHTFQYVVNFRHRLLLKAQPKAIASLVEACRAPSYPSSAAAFTFSALSPSPRTILYCKMHRHVVTTYSIIATAKSAEIQKTGGWTCVVRHLTGRSVEVVEKMLPLCPRRWRRGSEMQ